MSLNPNSKISFGKYKGYTVDKIRLCDPQYIVWLHDKANIVGPIKKEIEAIYDECVEAANKEKKKSGEPLRRKSSSQAFGPPNQFEFSDGSAIDFMGNYSDDDGAEIPNFGYMTNDEMDDHSHSMGGCDE